MARRMWYQFFLISTARYQLGFSVFGCEATTCTKDTSRDGFWEEMARQINLKSHEV